MYKNASMWLFNNFTHVYKVIIDRKRNSQAKSSNFAETDAVFRLMNNRVAKGKIQTRINLKKQKSNM